VSYISQLRSGLDIVGLWELVVEIEQILRHLDGIQQVSTLRFQLGVLERLLVVPVLLDDVQ
jgi:hypothetical protein